MFVQHVREIFELAQQHRAGGCAVRFTVNANITDHGMGGMWPSRYGVSESIGVFVPPDECDTLAQFRCRRSVLKNAMKTKAPADYAKEKDAGGEKEIDARNRWLKFEGKRKRQEN